MSKHCPSCGTKNLENNFWCSNCNARLLTPIDLNKKIEKSPTIWNNTNKHPNKSYNITQSDERPNKKAIFFVIIGLVVIIMIAANVTLSIGFDFSGINCKINEDFSFAGNFLNTSDGWTFKMTKLKDYNLDGIVLGLKTYKKNDIPYRPINIFSPIDLVIGVDDIKENPENYPFSITYCYRGYWLTYQDADAANYEYMRMHMGNNHIIPHDEKVLNELENISINDCVVIKGSLVSLYGTRGNEKYNWNTDTTIGNFACEIILVDELSIDN